MMDLIVDLIVDTDQPFVVVLLGSHSEAKFSIPYKGSNRNNSRSGVFNEYSHQQRQESQPSTE